MGRIVSSVKVASFESLDKGMRIDAMVDTGAMYLTLPRAWKPNFGEFADGRPANCTFADGREAEGEIMGPAKIEIEGFPATYGEVLFVDMKPDSNGGYEPLLGCIPLESSGIAVDMLGHRLVKLASVSVKSVKEGGKE